MINDGVILLHGIFRTKRSMQGLGRFLEANGYKTLNLGYPSTRQSIEKIAQHIRPEITAFAESIPGKLHFVGYSMGGLVIRAYLHRFRPERLGRVVMLGVPNQGSEVADWLKDWWAYRTLYGPAGQQLVTKLEVAEELLGQIDYELGIIAGNRSIDPISSWIIAAPNDGKVSIESTRITGMKDHIVIPATHTFFPTNKLAWQLILEFLREGCFISRTHNILAKWRNQ